MLFQRSTRGARVGGWVKGGPANYLRATIGPATAFTLAISTSDGPYGLQTLYTGGGVGGWRSVPFSVPPSVWLINFLGKSELQCWSTVIQKALKRAF